MANASALLSWTAARPLAAEATRSAKRERAPGSKSCFSLVKPPFKLITLSHICTPPYPTRANLPCYSGRGGSQIGKGHTSPPEHSVPPAQHLHLLDRLTRWVWPPNFQINTPMDSSTALCGNLPGNWPPLPVAPLRFRQKLLGVVFFRFFLLVSPNLGVTCIFLFSIIFLIIFMFSSSSFLFPLLALAAKRDVKVSVQSRGYSPFRVYDTLGFG